MKFSDLYRAILLLIIASIIGAILAALKGPTSTITNLNSRIKAWVDHVYHFCRRY